ncbi:MAG: type II toxin-antitoxin system VapC family toxin [Nitrospiraceae bacterium]|nr:type II toxin-antitoxin system VapC family toxin [Nitrospiraceae bacterium]
MSRVLLDTSGYSAFMRGDAVVKEMLQTVDAVYVNSVVLGELRVGFLRGRTRQKNEERLRQFLASSRVSIVAVDDETAERYAVILDALWTAGTPIPTNDIWIASSAMQYGLTVITTDAHYLKIPQILVWHTPPAK